MSKARSLRGFFPVAGIQARIDRSMEAELAAQAQYEHMADVVSSWVTNSCMRYMKRRTWSHA